MSERDSAAYADCERRYDHAAVEGHPTEAGVTPGEASRVGSTDEVGGASSAASGAGLDRLLTQMQETGRIPTGGRFNLAWLLGFLGELGIDPATVDINVRDERIEVVS